MSKDEFRKSQTQETMSSSASRPLGSGAGSRENMDLDGGDWKNRTGGTQNFGGVLGNDKKAGKTGSINNTGGHSKPLATSQAKHMHLESHLKQSQEDEKCEGQGVVGQVFEGIGNFLQKARTKTSLFDQQADRGSSDLDDILPGSPSQAPIQFEAAPLGTIDTFIGNVLTSIISTRFSF